VTVYFFSEGNHREPNVQKLRGSEVTRTIKQFEVEGGMCSSAP